MSLPKEPRQLMINLMYIVLTAILALNVSAEILNAFLAMDESISESSAIVGKSNQQIIDAITQQADAYSQFEPLREKAKTANLISKEFADYINKLKIELIEQSGGYDEEGKLVGIKNKDITTRMFVNEERGDTVHQKILVLRDKLLNLIEDETTRGHISKSIPLNIKPVPEDAEKKTWAEFNFQQMPVAAILPLLSKFQNDAKISETAILNYFLGQTDIVTMKPDAFEAVVAADKSYVISGEELTAEIFLGAYSSTADNIAVRVNGRPVPVRDGKAVLNVSPEGLGSKEMDVRIDVTNPISGEVKTYNKKFRYEVGERSVAVSADKMNVFYVGVENPVTISAAGIPSAEMKVVANNVELNKVNNNQFMAIPKKTGEATITVSGGGLNPTTFKYRVKMIPTPIPMLGAHKSGRMKPSEFKVYDNIKAIHENFDFDARCNITGFEITRVQKKGDPQIYENSGGNFDERTKAIVKQADFGDVYYFENIRAKCPGDIVTRQLSSMIFRIR
jgi:gliding motility-associated protein GldM